jgi:glycerol-3-phosphate acyltransferase PlsY
MTAMDLHPALAAGLALAVGYLFGALPWGLWLGRWLRGVDVRSVGSGNLGATNVYRALGPGLGVATLVLDIAKGAAPVWLVARGPIGAAFPGGVEWSALATGLAAVLGHVFTVFAGFKGGKGVATTVGVLLAISPAAFAAFVAVFLVVVGLTRYISLGSILGSITFAATLAAVAPGGVRSPTFAFGTLIATVVIVRHRENVQRLLRGEERRFSLKGGNKP